MLTFSLHKFDPDQISEEVDQITNVLSSLIESVLIAIYLPFLQVSLII
ncbi:MAG: hypothetical protein ACJAT4_000452 [Granulosicoccus sp.]|jgi:hypothetical protein